MIHHEKPLLSIIIVAYNEEENVFPLLKNLFEMVMDVDFEVVFVDDGSTDGTLQQVLRMKDPRIKIIELKRNFGQSAALSAGIEHADGEFIATMDADLQNDSADIQPMLKKITEEGLDLVAGFRKNRKDGLFLRRIPSLVANAMIRRSTGIKIRDYGCTLKIFKRELAQSLSIYGELHRFIPVLASFEGATISQMDVQHHPRIHGKSKYGINRTFRVISDLLLMLFFRKYMNRPMHLFGLIGLLLFGGGSLIELYLLILKIMGNDIWGKPVMILGVIMLILGIQFITIGIIAEMLMRTYYESQNKKPYKIRRITRAE
jgi:glycosyltransferase involved in cell wall biosynthesis